MRHIRAVSRLFLIFISTIFLFLLFIAGLLFARLLLRESDGIRNRCLTLWSGTISAILNMKIKITGHPPQAPFYLVSNHLSYIDILAMYRTLDCTFISNMDVASWPVVGLMARTMGVIFIDRKRKADVRRVNELISRSLNRYQGIVLFPEGTTSAGLNVLPFKASLLKHPAVDMSPVHYAAIRYRTAVEDPSAAESVCWWGDRSFPEHIYQLAGIRCIWCSLHFGEEAVRNGDRKLLADELHKKVSHLFLEKKSFNNLPQSSSITP